MPSEKMFIQQKQPSIYNYKPQVLAMAYIL